MTTQKEYFGSLDTLRFAAFLCVFVSHMFVFTGFAFQSTFMKEITQYLFTQGNLGVTFFFVLSGFLITYLLFKEKEKNAEVSVSKFYMRRILRIWPVYFTVVLIGFLILPIVSTYVPEDMAILFAGTEPSRIPWYIFFVANFDMVMHSSAAFFLAVLWSISVEEQFYAVWPWVVKKLNVKKMLALFAGLLVVSFIYRYIYVEHLEVLRYSTISFLSDLATGAFAAYLVRHVVGVKEYISKLPKWVGYILALCLPLFFTLHRWIEVNSFETGTMLAQIMYALVPQIMAIYFAGIIVYGCFSTGTFLHRKIRTSFEYLGRISYGLYCYHTLGILGINILISFGILQTQTLGGFLLSSLIALLCSILLAHTSYVYIEKPILRKKVLFEV